MITKEIIESHLLNGTFDLPSIIDSLNSLYRDFTACYITSAASQFESPIQPETALQDLLVLTVLTDGFTNILKSNLQNNENTNC